MIRLDFSLGNSPAGALIFEYVEIRMQSGNPDLALDAPRCAG